MTQQQGIPAPPGPDPRQRRHAVPTMTRAKQMYDGGWSIVQLQRYFAGRGIEVSQTTLQRWCVPGFVDVHRERNARRARERRREQQRRVVDRARTLRGAGLSVNAVRKVLSLDEGVELSAHKLRRLIEDEEQS